MQESSTQMLMQEMYVSESKYLLAIVVVPAAETIQIHSLSKTLGDVSEKTSHESEVICIYGDK